VAVTETDICNRALQRLGEQRIADMDTDTTKAGTACASAYDHIRDEVLRSHPWNCATKRVSVIGRMTVYLIANASPTVIEFDQAHPFIVGDVVTIAGALGMTEINADHTVASLPDSDSLQITLNSTGYGSYTSASATCSYEADPFGEGVISYKLPLDCLRVLGLYDTREVWSVEDGLIRTAYGVTTQDHPTLTTLNTTRLPFTYLYQNTDPDTYDSLLVSAVASRLAVELCEILTQSNTKRELAWKEYQQVLMDARRADGQEQSPTPLAEDDWVLARY